MSDEALSGFERAITERTISQLNDAALLEQFQKLRVRSREYTKVGCYTNFFLPSNATKITAPYGQRGPLDGPSFEHPSVEFGGGSLLWFKNGLIDCLELYAYGSFFPEDHSVLSDFVWISSPGHWDS